MLYKTLIDLSVTVALIVFIIVYVKVKRDDMDTLSSLYLATLAGCFAFAVGCAVSLVISDFVTIFQ